MASFAVGGGGGGKASIKLEGRQLAKLPRMCNLFNDVFEIYHPPTSQPSGTAQAKDHEVVKMTSTSGKCASDFADGPAAESCMFKLNV